MNGQAMEKVEGGKLLRIKTEFEDTIAKVSINGDFFAHPEDCIAQIEKKLEDTKTDFDEQSLATDLDLFITQHNFELLGIDAAAIARVLKKAVTTQWRVIALQTNDAFVNMAIDEAISESVANGGPPTIRFYKWKPSAVSIGYFQSLGDEVDDSRCSTLDVDIVRRRTGGGAVYHSNSGEITYSVIGKEALFPKNIIESYKLICGWVISGLKHLGISADFVPINDIVVSGKKISGNAQTRRGGVLLQHGTILHDVDVEKMFSLLKVPDEKVRDKMVAAVKDRVTRILNFKEVTQEQTYEALLKGFTADKEFALGELTTEELARAQELADERYSTKDWNWMK